MLECRTSLDLLVLQKCYDTQKCVNQPGVSAILGSFCFVFWYSQEGQYVDLYNLLLSNADSLDYKRTFLLPSIVMVMTMNWLKVHNPVKPIVRFVSSSIFSWAYKRFVLHCTFIFPLRLPSLHPSLLPYSCIFCHSIYILYLLPLLSEQEILWFIR